MLLSKTRLAPINTKLTHTIRKPYIRKVTALSLDQSSEIIGHGVIYFTIFYTTLNYLYYKSVQDDEDKD
jgi:hypothetical protein